MAKPRTYNEELLLEDLHSLKFIGNNRVEAEFLHRKPKKEIQEIEIDELCNRLIVLRQPATTARRQNGKTENCPPRNRDFQLAFLPPCPFAPLTSLRDKDSLASHDMITHTRRFNLQTS